MLCLVWKGLSRLPPGSGQEIAVCASAVRSVEAQNGTVSMVTLAHEDGFLFTQPWIRPPLGFLRSAMSPVCLH